MRQPCCSSQGAAAGRSTRRPRTAAAPAKATCAFRHGWQLLANRIGADVYCPGWLPDPLTSQIDGQWSNINSVSKDRSYLESFVWQDTDGPNASGELHVNLRGYPGPHEDPDSASTGLKDNILKPCFAGAARHDHGRAGSRRRSTPSTRTPTRGTCCSLWHHNDGLYTLSEHLAPPLDYRKSSRT